MQYKSKFLLLLLFISSVNNILYEQVCTEKFLQNDTTICLGTSLQLTVSINDSSDFRNTYSFSNTLQNRLLGWYPFWGDTNDISMSGNNVFPTGSLTYTEDRYNPNTAIQFLGNGTSLKTDKIDKTISNSLNFICDETGIINNDTLVCSGTRFRLSAKNALSYEWHPGKGLSDSTIQNPVAKADSNVTYYLESNSVLKNLVYNGDFEQSNSAFTTTYTYCNSVNCLYPLGNNGYSIGKDASFSHSLFQGKDHTSGGGNFMIINGADPNLIVWKKTINVLSNTNYAFGVWISTMIVRNTAKIRFSINGVQLGPIFDAPQELNKWVQVFTNWNSGNNTSATIEIVDTYNEPNGNDFGLDDIFFGEIVSCTDSIHIKAVLTSKVNTNAFICQGENYILPSGDIVSNAGFYNDTLKNIQGCDSLITTLNLKIINPVLNNENASICKGQFYKLPSGLVVNSPGIYNDTLKSTLGCDSLVTVVNLTVSATVTRDITTSICTGQTYTLPSGLIVNTAGLFIDTVKSTKGCDSLITAIKLKINSPTIITTNASICSGKIYTLPSGLIVNNAGVYNNTIKSTFGCDSLITVVNLTVSATLTRNITASICPGKIYTLPSGFSVSEAGIYADTIRTVTDCDSLITIVGLTISAPQIVNTNVGICSNETYTLPSGLIVNKTGIYSDTVRMQTGCDSLITIVNLKVNAPPTITINKSNDIDCILGYSKLTATGGTKYNWTPSSSLDNPGIYNPVAAPNSSTIYTVTVTNHGCVAKDSIEVKVTNGNANNGYFVASAFTPNNDGKNDCFSIRSWGSVSNLNFSVFDRLGNLVFHTTAPSSCWDGTYKGATLGTATFVYEISANTNCSKISRKGTVVLIR